MTTSAEVTTAPPPPPTETPAPTPEPAAEAPLFQINGFFSGSYSYNINSPASHTNQLQVFNVADQSFTLDVAELVFQRPVSDPGSVGFRIDLEFGSTIPPLEVSAGLVSGAVDIQQAYVSYLFKSVEGLKIDLGKFITHLGWEVIEGYDGYNDNFSRSILFSTLPFTHTGIKVSKTFSPMVSGSLLLVNGWDVAVDNNDTPSLGLQVVLTPNDMFQIYVNAIGGREEAVGDGLRIVGNLIAVAKATPTLTLVLDSVFGTESDAVGGTDSASWYGVAVYAKNQFTPEFGLTLRAEFAGDPDNFKLAKGEDFTAFEVTLTPSYAITSNFALRADLRFDNASEDIFETDDAADPSGSQFLIALNAVATF